jgi:hypothetical protein
LQAFDYENSGLIVIDDCKYALKQLKVVLNQPIDEAMRANIRQNFSGEYCVDYLPFARAIAKEAPVQQQPETWTVKPMEQPSAGL